MDHRKALACSVVLTSATALTSVGVESCQTFNIDAGSSWTAVWLVGVLIALVTGFWLRRSGVPFAKRACIASAWLTVAVSAPLLVGFGLLRLGVPVPWREPVIQGAPLFLPLALWCWHLLLMAVGLLTGHAARVGLRLAGRSVESRPEEGCTQLS